MWGIVYLRVGFSRASIQINDQSHTFLCLYIITLGVGVEVNDMKFLFTVLCVFLFTVFVSCGSARHMSILCNQPDFEIYIDGNYIGKGLVSYTIPRGINTIEIICKQNGKDMAKRIATVKNNALYEIYVSDDYMYTSDPIIYKSR